MTAENYIDAARSTATKKAYAADLAHFLANGGKLPSTPQQLSTYLAKLAATLAVATIERRLIGIHRAHQDRNLASPVTHNDIRQVMRGIRRTLGTQQRQVRALVRDELLELLVHLDRQKPMRAARDCSLLLMGFASALRRSELVALRCEDITWHEAGLEILLRRSKTDQEGLGRTVFVPYARGTRCPVLALLRWQELSGIREGYLFRAVNRHDHVSPHALTSQSVALILKAAFARAGRKSGEISGHSLRSGYVTSAVLAGLKSYEIREQTGHRSDVTLGRYIRPLRHRQTPSLL